MKDVEAATEFLDRLQPLLEAGVLRFEPRNRKTWEFMLAEGLGEEDAYDVIARLGPGNYKWGSRPDDNAQLATSCSSPIRTRDSCLPAIGFVCTSS